MARRFISVAPVVRIHSEESQRNTWGSCMSEGSLCRFIVSPWPNAARMKRVLRWMKHQMKMRYLPMFYSDSILVRSGIDVPFLAS